MRILVVEDEAKLARALKEGLEREHYEVALSRTGEEGFFRVQAETFDLVILDLMLPGRDGIEILRTLRKRSVGAPVLILTARDTVSDRIEGLDAGADDYLIKPFAFPELLAPVSLRLPDGTRLRVVTGEHAVTSSPATEASAAAEYTTLVFRLGHSEERLWHEFGELLGGFALGIPIALAAAGVGGYLLARRSLAPVDAMTRQAARISARSLSERLPLENPEDELGQLAGVLNRSLDDLQAAFQQLRRFTADASHELRTPLTSLRSVGEIALSDRRSPEAYREAIGSMLEEVSRLTRLVDSLLVLSRADAGGVALSPEVMSAFDAVREATSLVEVLAEERGQKVTVDGDSSVRVRADRLLLRQTLVNLLDNAIRYSPAGGRRGGAGWKAVRSRSRRRNHRSGAGDWRRAPAENLRALLPRRLRPIAGAWRRRSRARHRPVGRERPGRIGRAPE
jgi:signal transduction histidine kinase